MMLERRGFSGGRRLYHTICFPGPVDAHELSWAPCNHSPPACVRTRPLCSEVQCVLVGMHSRLRLCVYTSVSVSRLTLPWRACLCNAPNHKLYRKLNHCYNDLVRATLKRPRTAAPTRPRTATLKWPRTATPKRPRRATPKRPPLVMEATRARARKESRVRKSHRRPPRQQRSATNWVWPSRGHDCTEP